MEKRCPYCGVVLNETTFGRLFCPNCGIIEEEEDDKDTKDRSYIG